MIASAIIETVFLTFPTILPVTGSNVSKLTFFFYVCIAKTIAYYGPSTDYVGVVLAIIAVVMAFNTFLFAKKHGRTFPRQRIPWDLEPIQHISLQTSSYSARLL